MAHEHLDESVEMYLKSICELADGAELVPISALAQRLTVSIVSATEMVHRLGKRELAEHTPYRGVALTAGGKLRALRVIRRHRLAEDDRTVSRVSQANSWLDELPSNSTPKPSAIRLTNAK
jgi:DtxR family Mn-dependent transcriptional regulator